jgi:cytidylate kinase
MLASKISAQPGVRKALMAIQRELGADGGIVADGRDMGTVVFPEADFKFYLDADDSERSKRRYLELLQKNVETNLGDVREEMAKRDKQDMERTTAPLKPAEDAIIIDTTKMNIQEVVEKMLSIITVGNGPR